MNIVLASDNPGKLKELRHALPEHTLSAQSEYGITSAEETGLTFIENALIKARHAACASGRAALADDSGLEVAALNGAPGLYSARFSGPDATDARNNQALLTRLQDVPSAERIARFRCVIVLLRHPEDPAPIIAEGVWDGHILTAPRGEQGFGYDPLFWLPELHCSAAELSPEKKRQYSHRGQALAQLTQRLSELKF